jgi:hypothetical protein
MNTDHWPLHLHMLHVDGLKRLVQLARNCARVLQLRALNLKPHGFDVGTPLQDFVKFERLQSLRIRLYRVLEEAEPWMMQKLVGMSSWGNTLRHLDLDGIADFNTCRLLHAIALPHLRTFTTTPWIGSAVFDQVVHDRATGDAPHDETTRAGEAVSYAGEDERRRGGSAHPVH